MDARTIRLSLLISIIALPVLLSPSTVKPVQGAAVGVPLVSVWSDACRSSNITLTNPNCGPLTPGRLFQVEINVTNASNFNAYELSLYYDSHFLKFNASDTKTGTVFTNPFTAREDNILNGTYHLTVIAVPGSNTAPNGTLVHIYFQIVGVGVSPLVLAAGMATPSTSAFAEGAWTRLDLGGTPIDVATADGYFKNDPTKLGPVARFTYSPTAPKQGTAITFNATDSFDPDGMRGILNYTWDFGDGTRLTSHASIVTYSFVTVSAQFFGNFSVRLTVADADDHFQGMQVQRIYVEPSLYDLALQGLSATPSQSHAGGSIALSASVLNRGPFPETYNVTFSYGQPSVLIGEALNQSITGGGSGTLSFNWNTTGLLPGSYIVQSLLGEALDNNTANNSASVTIQIVGVPPPPTLPFDFTLSTPSPDSLTIVQGSTSPLSVIEASLVFSNLPYPLQNPYVGFSTSTLPRGITASFISYWRCYLDCTVALYFSANSTAVLGTVTVTVTANGTDIYRGSDLVVHSTTLSLTVAPRGGTVQPAWPVGSSLVVSNLGSTSVTLAWNAATDNAGVVSYRVYMNGSLISTVPGDKLNYDATGLKPGKAYVFRVEAGGADANWTSSGPVVTIMTSNSVAPSQVSFLEQYGSIVGLIVGVCVLGAILLIVRVFRRRGGPSSQLRSSL